MTLAISHSTAIAFLYLTTEPSPQADATWLSFVANCFGVLTGVWFIYEKIIAGIKARRSGVPPASMEIGRTRSDYVLGSIYSVLCAVLWSLSYVALSYVGSRTGLLQINVVLLGCGFIFLLIGFLIASVSRNSKIGSLQDAANWKTPTPWIVTLGNVASFLLFIYALRFISASQAITMQKINPIFVAVITWIWLKSSPSRSTLSTVFLVVSGTILITTNDQLSFAGGAGVKGSLLAILAGVSFAVFSVGLEKVEKGQPGLAGRLRFMAIVFLLCYLGTITAAYFQQQVAGVFDRFIWLILILNGLRIAVVYALFYAALRRIGALLASVVVAIEVPLTMLFDWTLLHRAPSLKLIWGALAILLGAGTLLWEKSSPPQGSKAVASQ